MKEYDVIHYYEAHEVFVNGREVKPFDVVTTTTGRLGSGKGHDAVIPVQTTVRRPIREKTRER